MKLYQFNISAWNVVEVEADSIEEAEELALDKFIDESDMWDDMDIELLSEEAI